MTYSVSLTQNEIKKIIADHIGNCKPENVHLSTSIDDSSYYGSPVITASVTFSGPITTTDLKKEAND